MSGSPVIVDLPVTTYGDPDAPRTALIVHGLTNSAIVWWRIAPRIAAAGFRVVAPDLRGHGFAPRTESYRMEEYAGDLLRLRPAHGGAWDLVIGHSLGGGAVTCALGTDPGWARSALLLDPAIAHVGFDPEAHKLFIAGLRHDTEDTDIERILAEHPNWHPEDAWTKARSGAQCSPTVVDRTMGDNDPWDFRDKFDNIDVPVTILGADPQIGAVTMPEVGNGLAAKYPSVTFRSVQAAEHGIQRTHPDLVVQTALEVADAGARGAAA